MNALAMLKNRIKTKPGKAQAGSVRTKPEEIVVKKTAATVKTETPKKAPKQKAQEVVEEVEEVEIPSAEEISTMKVAGLNEYHDMLPEPLDGWDDLKLKQKREALTEALHEFEGEEDTGTEDEIEAEIEEETHNVVNMRGKDKAEKTQAKPVKAKKAKKGSNGDPIDDAANLIENLTEDQADQEALHLLEDVNYNYFRLGGVLSVIDSKGFYGEYGNFRDKVQTEFGLKYGKARQLVRIYNDVLASGVSWDQLQGIGWTKLREISAHITEDNVDEWVQKCESMNVDTLRAEVRALSEDDSVDTSTKTSKDTSVSTMTFKLHEDQKKNVDDAIELAMQRGGTEHRSVALGYMALDFLAGGSSTRKMPTQKQFFDSLIKAAKGDIATALDKLLNSKAFEEAFPGVEIEASIDEVPGPDDDEDTLLDDDISDDDIGDIDDENEELDEEDED